MRKHNAGTLLKAVRSISKIELRDRSDFMNQPTSLKNIPKLRPTCNEANENTTGSVPKCCKCCSKCKPVTNSEVSTILKFKVTG